jgi:hypothetical protein
MLNEGQEVDHQHRESPSPDNEITYRRGKAVCVPIACDVASAHVAGDRLASGALQP